MPERSSLFQGVQIGAESTLGTGVAAGKLLNYLGIDIDPELAFARFRPMGQAVAGSIVPSQISSTAAISGQGSYSELIYPLNSIYGNVTPTTVDTTAKRWNWTYTGRAETTPKSYTVEAGGSVRAHKLTAGVFNGFEITFQRTGDGLPVSGSLIGQQMQDNITLTATPTALEDVPIIPTHCDVYMDPTSGALGTTKLTRDFNAVFRHNDAYGAIWPISSTNASWANVVGTEPTVQVELQVEADTAGMQLYADAVAGNATRFIRLAAVSTANAGAATAKYDLLIDMAGKVSAFGGFDDVDGVFVASFTFDAVYDAGWGAAVKVQNTNKTATL